MYQFTCTCRLVYRDSSHVVSSGQWLGPVSYIASSLLSGVVSKEDVILFIQKNGKVCIFRATCLLIDRRMITN